MKITNIIFLNQNNIKHQQRKECAVAKTYSLPFDTVSFGARVDFIKKLNSIPKDAFPSEGLRNYILSNISQDESLNISDLHKEYYANLLTCETLEEAKELYPEFRKVVDAKDMDLSGLRGNDIFKKISKGKFEGLTLENLSLKLLKKVYGELMPITDDNCTKENFNVRHPILSKMMSTLNIGMSKEYLSLIRASRQSKFFSAKWQEEDYRSHQTDVLTKANRDPERRAKLSEIAKQQWQDDDYRESQNNSRKVLWENKEYKNHMTQKRQEYWANPEARQRQSETIKKTWENDEIRQKHSQASKEMWAKDEHRNLMSIVYKANALAWQTHPTAREAFIEVAKEYPELGEIIQQHGKRVLTPREISIEKTYYKTCAERYPELAKEIGQIQKEILSSWGFYEEDRDINKILELIENM